MRRVVIRLAQASGVVPSAIFVEGVTVGCHVAYRSFGDVYEGILDGRAVAVKRPRIFQGKPRAEVMKVLLESLGVLDQGLIPLL